MSAAVIAVDTPYFGCHQPVGRVTIPMCPDGRYQLNVWYERSLPEKLEECQPRGYDFRIGRPLNHQGIENANFSLEHKNKYGQDVSSSREYQPCLRPALSIGRKPLKSGLSLRTLLTSCFINRDGAVVVAPRRVGAILHFGGGERNHRRTPRRTNRCRRRLGWESKPCVLPENPC